jgi:hypothetical protein
MTRARGPDDGGGFVGDVGDDDSSPEHAVVVIAIAIVAASSITAMTSVLLDTLGPIRRRE